jgi:hypothetical protein
VDATVTTGSLEEFDAELNREDETALIGSPVEFAATPEPGTTTLTLTGLGLLGLLVVMRKL